MFTFFKFEFDKKISLHRYFKQYLYWAFHILLFNPHQHSYLCSFGLISVSTFAQNLTKVTHLFGLNLACIYLRTILRKQILQFYSVNNELCGGITFVKNPHLNTFKDFFYIYPIYERKISWWPCFPTYQNILNNLGRMLHKPHLCHIIFN